jgi:pimeloyl-ACP methyl ester carboxylesterase
MHRYGGVVSTPRSVELPASVRAHRFRTARGDFAGLVSGPEQRSGVRGSVLLLPGYTGSKEDFVALLPSLAELGWVVATYDQRGQFETTGSGDDDYSLAGLAADAAAVADAVLEPGPHLVGHSFGGLVAREAAITDPARWASLTLLCSGPAGFTGRKADDLRQVEALLPTAGLEIVYEAKREAGLAEGLPQPDPEVEAFLRRRFLANSVDSLLAFTRHLTTTHDRTEDLIRCGVPTAVMYGEGDDAWPLDVQDDVARRLGVDPVVIHGAAHSPNVEQPKETARALDAVMSAAQQSRAQSPTAQSPTAQSPTAQSPTTPSDDTVSEHR